MARYLCPLLQYEDDAVYRPCIVEHCLNWRCVENRMLDEIKTMIVEADPSLSETAAINADPRIIRLDA